MTFFSVVFLLFPSVCSSSGLPAELPALHGKSLVDSDAKGLLAREKKSHCRRAQNYSFWRKVHKMTGGEVEPASHLTHGRESPKFS